MEFPQPICRQWLRLQSPYTGEGFPHPSPEIPQKSQKGLPRPPSPECQENVEKIPKDPKRSQKGVKINVRDFSDTFLTLRAGRPGKGLGGVETPVFGDCNHKFVVPRHSEIFAELGGRIELGVSEMGSAKKLTIDVRIDDAKSILKFRNSFSP